MHNLLLFIIRNRHWFLFVTLEVVAMALLFRYNPYQGSTWTSSANSFMGKIYDIDAGVKSFFSLAHVNDSLTQRNIILEQEVAQLTELCRSGSVSEAVIDSATRVFLESHEMVAAKVVGSSLGTPDNLITINRGESDGIESDMAVVAGNGVVGVVVKASSHYAIVMPLVNVRSRVSVRVKGHSYLGYVQWDADDPGISYVEDIPRYAQFEVGDSVETSGYSSIFPEGILVGQIIEKNNANDGVSFRLKVRLSVDFASVRDVRVIRNKDFAERARLLDESKEALESKK